MTTADKAAALKSLRGIHKTLDELADAADALREKIGDEGIAVDSIADGISEWSWDTVGPQVVSALEALRDACAWVEDDSKLDAAKDKADAALDAAEKAGLA